MWGKLVERNSHIIVIGVLAVMAFFGAGLAANIDTTDGNVGQGVNVTEGYTAGVVKFSGGWASRGNNANTNVTGFDFVLKKEADGTGVSTVTNENTVVYSQLTGVSSSNWVRCSVSSTPVAGTTSCFLVGGQQMPLSAVTGVSIVAYDNNGAVASPAPFVASGGDLVYQVYDGEELWRVHVFTAVGGDSLSLVSVPQNATVECLIVAGGGGGGYRHGSGGGAGGVVLSTFSVSDDESIAVTVGGGGGGATGPSIQPANGQNSICGTAEAIGGGGGAQWDTFRTGRNGGSGGGSAGGGAGLGTPGQGNNGGGSMSSSPYNWGGGGGAGAPGETGTTARVGDGGAGVFYGNQFGGVGVDGWVAGGGGGGSHDPKPTSGNRGMGGIGGGGNAGVPGINNPGGDAVAGSGGGGGGAATKSGGNSRGGNGGSGVVAIRYKVA